MGLSCRFSLNPIHWISQWEPKSSTRTFGEAANMLLCHRDSMMPLGIFRYPKAGLGAGGRKLMNSENNGYYIIYYQYIIIIVIIIIYIHNYIILSYLTIYYILVGCGGFDLNILRISYIVFSHCLHRFWWGNRASPTVHASHSCRCQWIAWRIFHAWCVLPGSEWYPGNHVYNTLW